MSNWRTIKVEFIEKEKNSDNLINLRNDFRKTGYDKVREYWIGELLSFNGVSNNELENGVYAFHTKGYITSLSTIQEIKESGMLIMEMEIPWEIKNTLDFISKKYNVDYYLSN